MAAVEGMVTIGLDVQLSALGSSLETRIAGYRVELRLPRPPLREDSIGLDGGELVAPKFQHVKDGERLRVWMAEVSSAPWGRCYARHPDGGDAAWVGRCALVVPLADDVISPQEVADAIFCEVDSWRSVVLDWLETAHGQPVGSTGPPRLGDAIDPWLWSHDGRKRVLHYNTEPLRASGSPGETAVDVSSLQRVLHLAGDLVRPPLAWRLTRDARRQHSIGEHRRAVLDAGTAAELALYSGLLRCGWEPRTKRTGEERQEPLGNLVDIVDKNDRYETLRIANARTGLVSVRNDAAHRAEMPSDQEAANALRISAAFVEKAWPRAELLTPKTGG